MGLTFNGSNSFPAWSPDGNWIAYSKSVCKGDNTCGIWMISSDGLNNNFIDDYGMFPTWDSFKNEFYYIKRIVTKEGIHKGDSLWFYQIESKTKKSLYFLPEENRHLAFSPKGSKIAFSFLPEECPGQIWSIKSDGSRLKRLTWEGGSSAPSWSPDDKIVFVRFAGGTHGPYTNPEIWMMNADGSDKKLIIKNGSGPSLWVNN